jgi:hypothetical protein
MAEPTQFTFKLQEVAIALLEKQGLKEGKWMLGFEFDFAAGNVSSGPEATDLRPTSFATIKSLSLVRQPDNAPEGSLVDAAKAKRREKQPGGKR